MLDVKKANSWTVEEDYRNELDIIRFKLNEVTFDTVFDDNQNI